MSLEEPTLPFAPRFTRRQLQVLRFIAAFRATEGYAPTVREIMRGLGLHSPSAIQYHIDNLIRKGELRRRDRSPRSLALTRADGVMGAAFALVDAVIYPSINSHSDLAMVPTERIRALEKALGTEQSYW